MRIRTAWEVSNGANAPMAAANALAASWKGEADVALGTVVAESPAPERRQTQNWSAAKEPPPGFVVRNSRLRHDAIRQQRALHRLARRMMHFAIPRKLHFGFRRMHVHIHQIGMYLHEQRADRITAVRRQGTKRLFHRMTDQPAFDRTAIDKKQLMGTSGTRNIRRRNKARHIQARQISCAIGINLRATSRPHTAASAANGSPVPGVANTSCVPCRRRNAMPG